MNLNQVTLPALDIDASVAFYRRLGFVPVVLAPHYARFAAPTGDATLSVHRVDGPRGSTSLADSAVIYFECADLDATVADLRTRGVAFSQEPRDESWLWREARFEDPAGNRLCLYHAGEDRRHPPWRVPATATD